MSQPFPTEADQAINIVTDCGFATVEQAVKAVQKRLASDEIAEHRSRRDWIECIREYARTRWDGIEKTTKPSRGVAWQAYYSTGRTARPGVHFVEPHVWSESWRSGAMLPAIAMLKAEKRCKAAAVDKAANWLSRNPEFWQGGRNGAFRRCSIESAFDWYVLLVVVLNQKFKAGVEGFETDWSVAKRIGKRKGGAP